MNGRPNQEADPREHAGSDTEDRLDILFRYYSEQWSHVRHHEMQRVSMTTQLIVVTGALSLAYFQVDGTIEQVALARYAFAVMVLLLGILGLLFTWKLHVLTDKHAQRARSARKEIGFLEEHAQVSQDFPKINGFFAAFHLIVIAMAVTLFLLNR